MAQGGLAGYAGGNRGNLPSPEERRTYDLVLQLVFAPEQVSQGILILRGQVCKISQMLEMIACQKGASQHVVHVRKFGFFQLKLAEGRIESPCTNANDLCICQ